MCIRDRFKQLNAPLSGVTPTATLENYQLSTNECYPGLGYLWSSTNTDISQTTPLGLWYTAGGQIAGLRIEVWGAGAAAGRQVSDGYYVSDGDDRWHMSVSFRASDVMCSGETDSEVVGDRLVINQDTIAKSIPMTSDAAAAAGFMPGSCMKSMGQHWMYDLEDAPSNSWVSGNLLPVVPMYHAPGAPEAGKINAFFFASPVCQGPNNEGADTAYSWDNVPSLLGCGLSPSSMCENFCATDCSTSLLPGTTNPWASSGTTHWATMHIFFNADPKEQPTCPGFSYLKNLDNPGAEVFHRTCPANTQTPNTDLNAVLDPNGHSSSSQSTVVAVVVVLTVVAIFVTASVVVYKKRQSTGPEDVVQQLKPTEKGGNTYDALSTQDPRFEI
eukprot:TRINITY_DN1214_c0_g1_i1.p1 TRINITY_DN1214_c0_g1~~TRINITY_DN1214_c0_g1_i1.p1  ORF type:complete len:386 (+),score=101.56 TRINITY_DN1214_c0_g1_i1:151-1308(+)